MAQVKVIMVRQFSYRGSPEEYSNAYHFTGANPADSTAAAALCNAVRDLERAVVTSQVTHNRAYLYNAGALVATYVFDQTAVDVAFRNGTLASGVSIPAPGDCAMWVRWDTGRVSTSGKKIYIRKYFHGVRLESTGGDTIFAAQQTALTTYAGKMTDGTLPLGRKVCDKLGNVGGVAAKSTFATTRTLKRRGHRAPAP